MKVPSTLPITLEESDAPITLKPSKYTNSIHKFYTWVILDT